MAFDKNLEQWYPDDNDPVTAIKCSECHCEIWLDHDRALTNGKHYWCSEECALEFFLIEEV